MKTLVFDIETSHLHPEWGVILVTVVQEYPNGKPEVFRLDDRCYRQPSRADDSLLVAALVKRLSEADVLVAHNGVFFDRMYVNARALRYGGLIVDPRGKFIDPVALARRHFRLGSNSLETIATHLGSPVAKTKLDGETWKRAAMDRDKEAMDYITEHCVKDVAVLTWLVGRLLAAKCESKLIGQVDAYGSAR